MNLGAWNIQSKQYIFVSCLKLSVLLDGRKGEYVRVGGPSGAPRRWVWRWQEAGGWWQHLTQGHPRFWTCGFGVPDTGRARVNIAGPYLTPGLGYHLEKYFVPELSIVSPAFFLFPSSLCFPSGLNFLLASCLPIWYSLISQWKFCCYPVEKSPQPCSLISQKTLLAEDCGWDSAMQHISTKNIIPSQETSFEDLKENCL